jgi:hypothetical protein
MLSLQLRDIQMRVASDSYMDHATLPGHEGLTLVVAVPAGRTPGGRSRSVLLGEDGQMWLKYSANVSQPEHIEPYARMHRSLASWKAAEELLEAVGEAQRT